jgi:DUF1680 family protein
MFSLRVNYEITANISFMDRLEVVAFNALPAALYPDATTNVYVNPWLHSNLCCPQNVANVGSSAASALAGIITQTIRLRPAQADLTRMTCTSAVLPMSTR